jgi:hypothetical protein
MYEDIMLYGLFEQRMAERVVEARLRARQLGEAYHSVSPQRPTASSPRPGIATSENTNPATTIVLPTNAESIIVPR